MTVLIEFLAHPSVIGVSLEERGRSAKHGDAVSRIKKNRNIVRCLNMFFWGAG